MEHSKQLDNVNQMHLTEAEALSESEGRNLEKRLKAMQEKVKSLSKTVNPVAQSMLENEEKKVRNSFSATLYLMRELKYLLFS